MIRTDQQRIVVLHKTTQAPVQQAVKLLIGVIAMLVVAGVVEAFISPTLMPHEIKFMVAIALSLLLWWYLLLRPLPPPRIAPPTGEPAP